MWLLMLTLIIHEGFMEQMKMPGASTGTFSCLLEDVRRAPAC